MSKFQITLGVSEMIMVVIKNKNFGRERDSKHFLVSQSDEFREFCFFRNFAENNSAPDFRF